MIFDEQKIRLCAHLAAYFSKSRLGSSVEVHYTQARNIKKIPGGQLGLVSLSTHKSIFIDPDKELIDHYIGNKKPLHNKQHHAILYIEQVNKGGIIHDTIFSYSSSCILGHLYVFRNQTSLYHAL